MIYKHEKVDFKKHQIKLRNEIISKSKLLIIIDKLFIES